MSFKDLAAPYIAMGFPVFPLQPRSKVPPEWMLKFPDLASTDPKQIDEWDAKLPDANLALLAKADKVGDVCFLEFDIPKGMNAACAEMGQEFPMTRVHISGRKFGHLIFTHTERSLTIGNRNANLAGGKEWFSFRANNRYVLGPGSIHDTTGNLYGIANGRDIMPIPMPDWVCSWIEKYTVSEKKMMGDLPPVSEDFDFDEFCESLPFSLLQDGDWHIASFCPGVGRRHKHSLKTGIYFDGEVLGWKCFAQGCPCAYNELGMKVTIGGMLKFLRAEFDWEYDGVIWDEQTDEEMLEDFGAELVDLDEAEKAIFGGEPTKAAPDMKELFAQRDATVPGSAEEEQAVDRIMEAILPSQPEDTHPCNRCGAGISDKRMTSVCDACVEKKQPLPEPQPEPELKDFEIELAKGKLKGTNDIYSLVAVQGTNIQEEAMEWLVPDKIPFGEITVFFGQGGSGKTSVVLDIISRATTGAEWPGGIRNECGPVNVLVLSIEDSIEKILRPKLRIAGADLDRVLFVKRVEIKGRKNDKRRLQLKAKADILLLRKALANDPSIKIVFFDPLASFLGAANPNKDEEVRPILEDAQAMLRESNATVIGIMHTNKRTDVDAMGSIKGAGAFNEVIRSAWSFMKDPEKKDERLMSHVKGSYTERETGLKFRLASVDAEIAGKARKIAMVEWLGETDETGDEVLARKRQQAKEGGQDKKIDMVKLLLQKHLDEADGGCILLRDFYELCGREGLGDIDKIKKTVQRAIKAIGAVCKKPPHKNGPWWIMLDCDATPWNVPEKTMTADEGL
jgi:hypothetical protein